MGTLLVLIVRRQVSKEEGEALAKSRGMMYFEASAKTGDNVDKCFMSLTQEIWQRIVKGEIDVTNESVGVRILKPTAEHPGPGCQC